MQQDILAIAPRPPDPDGSPADRALYKLLTRLSRTARVQCIPQAPPLSWRTLRAALAVNGVEVKADWTVPQGDFFERIRQTVRTREFSAVIVAGAEAAQQWLKPLRMLAPAQTIVCYLPEANQALGGLADGAQDPRTRWKRALSFADAVWVDEPGDALVLQRAGVMLGGETPAAAATGRWNAREFAQAMSAAAKSRGAARGSVELSAPGLPRAESAALLRGAKEVAGRASASESVSSVDAVAALNCVLAGSRAEYLWLCAHSFKPSQNLFRTLWEGMRVLPFAGGAAPVDCARRPGAKPGVREDLFEAAWALGRKGDWHEVDHLSHFCCVLLRRRAVKAAGLLDERFLDPQYALIDYCLRLQQAGYPVYQARDALVFCRQSSRRPAQGAADDDQRELLVEKWSKGSLKLMESLSTALEPRGYRMDPVVAEGFRGTKK
ncbi:MAG: hypothetical protein HY077_00955 [Elusimicrobia bacterium]|nr:hypothetical protein [Elusimicrobiota bacterium]